MLSGEVADPFVFACHVRHVFASCYLGHGNPFGGAAIAKKCERLDALFEQQVLTLPRKVR